MKKIIFIIMFLMGCTSGGVDKCEQGVTKVGYFDLKDAAFNSEYGKRKSQQFRDVPENKKVRDEIESLMVEIKELQNSYLNSNDKKGDLPRVEAKLKILSDRFKEQTDIYKEKSNTFSKNWLNSVSPTLEGAYKEVVRESNAAKMVEKNDPVDVCTTRVDLTEMIKKRFDEKMKLVVSQ